MLKAVRQEELKILFFYFPISDTSHSTSYFSVLIHLIDVNSIQRNWPSDVENYPLMIAVHVVK